MTFLQAIRLAFKYLRRGGSGSYVMQYRTTEERLAMKTLIRRKFGLEGVNRVSLRHRTRIDSYSLYERERESSRALRDDFFAYRPTFNSNDLDNLCAEVLQGSTRSGATTTGHMPVFHHDIDNFMNSTPEFRRDYIDAHLPEHLRNLEVAATQEGNLFYASRADRHLHRRSS